MWQLFFLCALCPLALFGNRTTLLQSGAIDSVVESMTLEEKVGQLFFSFFYGEELDAQAEETIKETHLGNVMYYSWANGLKSPAQVRRLSSQVQETMSKYTRLPGLIAVDQEGGYIFRLGGQFTAFPGNMPLGAIGDETLTRQVGLAMAQELKACGINVNFAPVVDINRNPSNPVIGVRSFGDNHRDVIQLARAFIRGMHEVGIFVTLKHFPGHGDTSVDSHFGLPVLYRTKEELYEKELSPFRELHGETDLIMSAHILLPQLDAQNPASLSSFFLKDLLRKEIGYRGVVISDSLVMQGIVPKQSSSEEAFQGVAEAAIRAFQAGSDCLILGRLEWATFPDALSPEMNRHLTQYVIHAFIEAVRNKRISEEQVDESVRRILLLKQRIALPEGPQVDLSSNILAQHQVISLKVAQGAVTLLSSKTLFDHVSTRLSDRRVLVIAPFPIQEVLENAATKFPSMTFTYLRKEDLSGDIGSRLVSLSQQADVVLFLSWNGHLWKGLNELLYQISRELPPEKLLVVGLRNPQDVGRPEIVNKNLVYATYSATIPSLRALLDSLEMHQLPQGKLPMRELFCTEPQQCSN